LGLNNDPRIGEAQLIFEQELLENAVVEFAGGSAALFSMRCPGKETPNEDAVALIPTGKSRGVFAVADGLGGAPAGKQASYLAVQCLASAVTRAVRLGAEVRSGILDGFESANENVLALAIGAATTLTVAEFDGQRVRHYHVGDSMALLAGQRGKVKMRSIPHSLVGHAVEAGLLAETDAMYHEDRHVISNFIGSADMRIEIGSAIKIASRDTLVLASDGLSDNLHLPEIVECVRKGPLASVARKLASQVRERMKGEVEGEPSKPDDLTFVIFRLAH
jgi:serine/threonine protein phosphatase PrpC